VLLDSGSEIEDNDLFRVHSDSTLSSSSNALDLRKLDSSSTSTSVLASSGSSKPHEHSRVSLNPSILREMHVGSSETSYNAKSRKSYYERQFMEDQVASTPSLGGSSSRKSSDEQISPHYQSDNVFSESFPNYLDQTSKGLGNHESSSSPWLKGKVRASHSAQMNNSSSEIVKPRLKRTNEINSRVSSSVDMVLPPKATSLSK
jgi:hypothetical protein